MFGLIIPIGVGGLIVFALWFWAILDCVATDNILVRNLPKTTWIIVLIFIPLAGSLAWLLLGRPEHAGFSIGGNYRPPVYTDKPRPRGYEDSDAWRAQSRNLSASTSSGTEPATDIRESTAAKERRLLEWEAELAKREAALDEPTVDETGDSGEGPSD